jgi:hypothetical protein
MEQIISTTKRRRWMGMENVSEKLPDGTDLVGINLTGMVTGSAHVSTGTAIIRGMVCGDLIVEEAARCKSLAW